MGHTALGKATLKAIRSIVLVDLIMQTVFLLDAFTADHQSKDVFYSL